MKRTLLFTVMVIIFSSCNSAGPTMPPPRAALAQTEEPVLGPTQAAAPTQAPVPTQTVASAPLNPQQGSLPVVCTNTLSDASAINAAIAGSAPGDEIVISGQCLISESIKLLGDRSYLGTSRTGTRLRQADGANLVALLATDTFLENRAWTGAPVSIRHMTLDGNSQMNQGTPTDGIVLRSWLSVVEDVFITGMSQDGIRLASRSANGTGLTTSQVNGRISGNLVDRSGRYGVYVESGVTDWSLLDNWIAFSGVDGLHLEDAAGWVIERNHIYGVPQNAIFAEHLYGTSISDNYIEGFGETTQSGTWHGIYATIQGDAASTIAGNRISDVPSDQDAPRNPDSIFRFIALAANYGTAGVSVTGNTIRGRGEGNETGLYYDSGNDQLAVSSFGNLVLDVLEPRFTVGRVSLQDGY